MSLVYFILFCPPTHAFHMRLRPHRFEGHTCCHLQGHSKGLSQLDSPVYTETTPAKQSILAFFSSSPARSLLHVGQPIKLTQ